MQRRVFLRSSLGLGAVGAFGGAGAGPSAIPSPDARAQAQARARAEAQAASLHWERRALFGFGTTLSLHAGHADAQALTRALDAAVAVIRRIEAQMSLFDARSALSVLNRDGMLDHPPAELLAVLRVAQAVSQRSSGAFDATVQPLWLAFAQAQREGRLPARAKVAQARARVDWHALVVTEQRIRFTRPGMAATLNGIAQGHASDRVRAVLQQHGVQHALIDTGEFAALGRNVAGEHWTLGIADPKHPAALIARLVTDGRCIATSADDQTVFSEDHRHHHIFDPHSGYSPTELASVTVIAKSGALADALTKVFFVAGAKRALPLARAWGVDVVVVDKAGRSWGSGVFG